MLSVSRVTMLPFKLVYSDAYYLPIGDHVFPAEKYRRIRDRLISTGVADADDFLEPQPASDQDILLVHKPEYVQKLKTGTLSPREEMEMEIPYSRELVEAFWLAAGGSILAARQCLTDRVCISIGGGFHHAFPDHGEGFCMIHDVAVAIRRMQRDDKIRTAMTVDCDVHQGNGTAAIFAGTRTASALLPSSSASTVEQPAKRAPRGKMRGAHAGDVFTISLHQHNNYPLLEAAVLDRRGPARRHRRRRLPRLARQRAQFRPAPVRARPAVLRRRRRPVSRRPTRRTRPDDRRT